MAFEINRLHKLEDNLDSHIDSVAYEWCVESIRSHFDLGYEKEGSCYKLPISAVKHRKES